MTSGICHRTAAHRRFGEAQAARNVGARLVVIRRPADSGEDYAAVLNECREMMACR
ncbi:MAG: hypothetical protein ACLRZH_07960 [Ruthenibacterium lactatiformans]